MNSKLFLQTTIAIATSSILGLVSLKAEAALLVGNTRGNNVVLYDDAGNFKGNFIAPGAGGLLDPDDLTFGPDGNLYVSSGNASGGKILRYSGKTGAFIDEFASGGLIRPYGSAFGADGNLYVSSFLTDQILRFDGKTGAFIDVFASAKEILPGDRKPGQLNGPNDLLFTPDGRLLVTTQGSIAIPDPDRPGSFKASFTNLPSQVLSYDTKTGASTVFIDQPSPSPSSSFVSLLGLAIGPQGDLFVSDFANDIRRHDLATGALKDTLSTNYTASTPSRNFTGNLAFAPGGNLYAVGFEQNTLDGAILRFNGFTGQPLPAAGNTGALFVLENQNLKRPIGIAYADIKVPEPETAIALVIASFLATTTLRKRDRSMNQRQNNP